MSSVPGARPLDQNAATTAFRRDVLAGLAGVPKRLPSKYFYDARGSALFEAICAQPEYYLTTAELDLMRQHAARIAAALGPRVGLIEYGSGSGIKTRLLLNHLESPASYTPVEISASALASSVTDLQRAFPGLRLRPLQADFTRPLALPPTGAEVARRVLYFPGSTLGNFDAAEAVALLAKMRREVGPSGAALIGFDRVKSPAVLEAAYNDAAGVTAAFTLNLLTRINRELGADFDLAGFAHRARWNALAERIETDLVSRQAHCVRLDGRAFEFAAGESIRVEISCKYTPASFARLAAPAGWRVEHAWSDAEARFTVALLLPSDAELGHD
ncbi:MAG TPA: L-histidine N(alpha)-methyltransferase [Rhodanobacteraceae bacterium]|nr:L-histidine N(alpha)-methyltransferase [Rhodanobacteraceae bacterium]